MLIINQTLCNCNQNMREDQVQDSPLPLHWRRSISLSKFLSTHQPRTRHKITIDRGQKLVKKSIEIYWLNVKATGNFWCVLSETSRDLFETKRDTFGELLVKKELFIATQARRINFLIEENVMLLWCILPGMVRRKRVKRNFA